MGLINELGGQPYSFIHTSFTAIVNVKMAGGNALVLGWRKNGGRLDPKPLQGRTVGLSVSCYAARAA